MRPGFDVRRAVVAWCPICSGDLSASASGCQIRKTVYCMHCDAHVDITRDSTGILCRVRPACSARVGEVSRGAPAQGQLTPVG